MKREIKIGLIIFAVGVAIYHFWRVNYFGEILPVPFVSKSLSLSDKWFTNFKFYFQGVNFRYAPFGYFYAGLGVLAYLSNRKKFNPALVICCVLAMVYLYVVDWMPMLRYFVPLIPLILISVDIPKYKTPLVVMLIVASAWGYHDGRQMSDHMKNTRVVGRSLKALARPGDILAVGDVGAIPYYSELRTLDINSHALVDRYTAKNGFKVERMLKVKPTWVVIPSATHYLEKSPRVCEDHSNMIQSEWFQARMVPIAGAEGTAKAFPDMNNRCYVLLKLKW